METKNLNKLIAMAAGQSRNQFDENSISSDVRDKIDNALESVFMGKSILIWVHGGKLSAAWECAMKNLLDQIFAIKNTAPIVEYLRIAVFALRNRWEIKMLQSNERNSSVTGASDEEISNLQNYANSLIESGMGIINGLLNTGVSTNPERKQQKNMAMNMERTNSHEYEHIRTR